MAERSGVPGVVRVACCAKRTDNHVCSRTTHPFFSRPAPLSWHISSCPGFAMAKTFVAINDRAHRLLRNLTRQVPLCSCRSADGFPAIEYRIRPKSSPEAYYSLAFFHALEGLSLAAALSERWRVQAADKAAIPQQVGYFDALRLDRRCCRDLRYQAGQAGPGMVAAEACSVLGQAFCAPAMTTRPSASTARGGTTTVVFTRPTRQFLPVSTPCVGVPGSRLAGPRRKHSTRPISFMGTRWVSWSNYGNGAPIRCFLAKWSNTSSVCGAGPKSPSRCSLR